MSTNETQLFVAVPGADPYQAMPRREVADQIAKGTMRKSQLIWSEKRNEWTPASKISSLIAFPTKPKAKISAKTKTGSTMADVRPVGKITGAVKLKAKTGGLPKVKAAAASPVANPKAAVSPKPAAKKAKPSGHSPQAKAPRASYGKTRSQRAEDLVIKEEGSRSGFLVKLVCGLLLLVIVGLLGINWYFVDRPFKAKLAAQSPEFSDITAYAHLGGFFQTGSMVLHVPASTGVTKDNFLAYLTALAKATPNSFTTGKPYKLIVFGPYWYKTPYYIAGVDWKHITQPGMSDEDKREYLMESIRIGGTRRMLPNQNLVYEKRLEQAQANWNGFRNLFLTK